MIVTESGFWMEVFEWGVWMEVFEWGVWMDCGFGCVVRLGKPLHRRAGGCCGGQCTHVQH